MNLFRMNPTVMNSILHDTAVANPMATIQIRPVQPDDADLILAMNQRLSDDSLYKRYHTPRLPTRREIDAVCQLGGKNGRVLVAAIPGKTPRIVGMAYYVVTGSDAAEAAFLVEDQYQGQGIGKRLMHHLTQQAIIQGIYFLDAAVLPSNRSMIHLLKNSGRIVHDKLGHGSREIRVQLKQSENGR